jgi:hypothetical protein
MAIPLFKSVWLFYNPDIKKAISFFIGGGVKQGHELGQQ